MTPKSDLHFSASELLELAMPVSQEEASAVAKLVDHIDLEIGGDYSDVPVTSGQADTTVEVSGRIHLQLRGSLANRTARSRRFDVDVAVVADPVRFRGQFELDEFGEALAMRSALTDVILGRLECDSGFIAHRVRLDGHDIDLTPFMRRRQGERDELITTGEGGYGDLVVNFPERHRVAIQNKDRETSGRFRIVVRCIKALRDLVVSDRRDENVSRGGSNYSFGLSSYAIETVALLIPPQNFMLPELEQAVDDVLGAACHIARNAEHGDRVPVCDPIDAGTLVGPGGKFEDLTTRFGNLSDYLLGGPSFGTPGERAPNI